MRSIGGWLGALLSLSLLTTVMAAPARVSARQPARIGPQMYLPGEKALMEKGGLQARPLDLSAYANLLKPRVVDYSNLINYVRCQDYGGGCMMYATLAAADIINEFQAPYTPDLSWQYALRSWDEIFNARLATNPNAPGPDLTDVFAAGVASEGLCRSESDYLTLVPKNDPAYAIKDHRLYFDPAPEPEAREEAQVMKFRVTDTDHAITPSIDTLKTLLLTHGPVWSEGGWWWNGAHAMCFVGYDDNKQEFKLVNSQGDWWGDRGFCTIPYDKLTSYVTHLRTVDLTPTARYDGRWAYSSRLRIHGTWRGTWSVNIGVQGQIPETVYRSYGRLPKMPYCYGERLDIDVPLPAYADKFWPPKSKAKWYLQVEDNDRDGQTGQVVEWILAKRYQDPNCGSVDQWKTQTFKYSKVVTVPDATGDPVVSPAPGPGTAAPPQRNSNPGLATLTIPEQDSPPDELRPQPLLMVPRINLDTAACVTTTDGLTRISGKLTGAADNAMPNRPIELCQLVRDDNVNKPPSWIRLIKVQTGGDGGFVFNVKLPALGKVVLGVAYRGYDGLAMCSTQPLVHGTDLQKWIFETRPFNYELLAPRPGEGNRPRPQRP
jgi:hypothetical protein